MRDLPDRDPGGSDPAVTDFEYDVMQKKRLSRGAYHKKNGSKSRRCTLPSDHLTAAQKKGLSGTVSTYNLNQPMGWGTFRMMPPDLQEEYIAGLQNRFGVSASRISEDLFRKSPTTLRLHMARAGLKFRGCKGQLLTGEEHYRWHGWLNGEADSDTPVPDEAVDAAVGSEEEIPTVGETAVETKAVIESLGFSVDNFAAEFCGEFDTQTFLRFISRFPMPEGQVRIRLEVTRE